MSPFRVWFKPHHNKPPTFYLEAHSVREGARLLSSLLQFTHFLMTENVCPDIKTCAGNMDERNEETNEWYPWQSLHGGDIWDFIRKNEQ